MVERKWDRFYTSRYCIQQIKHKIRALKATLLVDTKTPMVLDVHVTTTGKHNTLIAP